MRELQPLHNMQHLPAALLVAALAIVFNERAVDAWAPSVTSTDQAAVEAKNKAVTIVEGPKQEKPPQPIQPVIANQTNSPELRPPSKPPIVTADKFYLDLPKHYYNSAQKHQVPPAHRLYTKDQLKQFNSVYKPAYPSTRPMQHGNLYYSKPPPRQPLLFAASTGKPTVAQTPKYSIPVQTINGIRADFVRPPHFASTTTTTTTQTPTTTRTTTRKVLRTKRIWPKRILEKYNITAQNNTENSNDTSTNDLASSLNRLNISFPDKSISTTTSQTTTRGYRRVTRTSKVKYTTPASFSHDIEQNDWVPILPSHFGNRKTSQTPMSRRSDRYLDSEVSESNARNLLYLQSYGLLPVSHAEQNIGPGVPGRNMVFFRKKKKQTNPYAFASSTLRQPQYAISAETRPRAVLNSPPTHAQTSYISPPLSYNNVQPQESSSITKPSPVTKVKHHHHHHHHRYVKTVEKPVEVPVKVEVPKPYPVEKKVPVPVPVEKVKVVDRPYPVQVEKKVPYPVTVRVPQPIPVKVVEKEYVPKPFPVVHHVPVVQHVPVRVPHPVPVQVEKRIPYPVRVPFTVEKRVPYPVTVEKQVPYPYPIKVYVPQPYPVEKRVPYPVEVKVKEPFEVIRHIKVPVLKPYAVKVPHPIPVTIEKKVPYPIRVEKKVPYPVEVLVPQRIHVEKKVPVYIPRPYPVEKRVPYPVKVPYPIKVPVKVPVEVPVQVPVYIHHPFQILNQQEGEGGSERPYYNSQYSGASENPYYADGASESSYYGDEDADRIGRSGSERVTSAPLHSAVAVRTSGNTGYNGVIARSDSEATTVHPVTAANTTPPTKS